MSNIKKAQATPTSAEKRVDRPVILKKELDRLEKLFAEFLILKSKERGVVDNIEGMLRKLTDKVYTVFSKQGAVLVPFVQTAPIKPVKSKMTVFSPPGPSAVLKIVQPPEA
jgi:hypothetical protein